MHTQIKRLVQAALIAALACIATMLVKIPSPVKGYINLGDCIVLVAGWVLTPFYGFLAAGIGSAMADLFSGYMVYVPATFLIKGLMALAACYGYKLLRKPLGTLPARLLSGAAAEVIMLLGYFLFAGILYGFGPALLNIPGNIVQGIAGLAIGIPLTGIVNRSKLV